MERHISLTRSQRISYGLTTAVSYLTTGLVLQADDVARLQTPFFAPIVERFGLDSIPSEHNLVNWYGSDFNYPFSIYMAARTMGVNRRRAAECAFLIPASFEMYQYVLRNQLMMENGPRFDPIDFAVYGLGVVAALAVDRLISKQFAKHTLPTQPAPQETNRPKAVIRKRGEKKRQ